MEWLFHQQTSESGFGDEGFLELGDFPVSRIWKLSTFAGLDVRGKRERERARFSSSDFFWTRLSTLDLSESSKSLCSRNNHERYIERMILQNFRTEIS